MMTSNPDEIGFAILGTGMVAEYHRKAILANAELGARLVAVGHHDPDRFPQISAQFDVPCLGQADLLAHPNVDVVCLCTPSGQHAEQAVAAARAGKHVLVEKPMALTLDDADAMIAACREAGVQLGVTLQRRALAPFNDVRRSIAAGDLGELTLGLLAMPYYRAQAYYDSADWRGTWRLDGGGALMNQGIHMLDLLVWYMGDPVAVRAQGRTLHHTIEVEDTVVAVLDFKGGATATVAATTTAAPGAPHRLDIYGTKGFIQIEGEAILRREWVDPAGAQIDLEVVGPASGAGAGADPGGIQPDGHIAIVKDFIAAVRHERAPLVNGDEGRRSLAAVLAIYEAAGLGASS